MKNIFTNFSVASSIIGTVLIVVLMFGSSQNVFAQTDMVTVNQTTTTSSATANQSVILDLKNNLKLRSTDAKTNGEVTLLQNFLKVNGYPTLKPTGIFDKPTLKAVKSFQKANKLSVNGVVGKTTREKIKSMTGVSPVVVTTKSTTPATNPTSKKCDNYECLIQAASQCQPISVILSYSGIPFPFNPDILVSGKTQYEIKKSSDVNNCIFTFSSPSTSFSISDKNRKEAINQGLTNNQIDTQLQTMNDSSKSMSEASSTCSSSANTISTYLRDLENNSKTGNLDFRVESQLSLTGSINTYTTSTGQKLVCTASTLQGQSASKITQ